MLTFYFDFMGLFEQCDRDFCPEKQKRVPYHKRDIVKSPISFGFHGKLEAVGAYKILYLIANISAFDCHF